MKATELRIGNLVKLNNKDFHAFEDFYPMNDENNIWVIECIFRNGQITMYNTLENLWKSCEVSDIENIELTEEWLLKFGFTSIMNNCVFQKINFLGNIYSRKKSFFFEYVFLKVELKHVHQLQNIYFALTNKEL